MSELEPIKAAIRVARLYPIKHKGVFQRWACSGCTSQQVPQKGKPFNHSPDCCEDLARAVVDALPDNHSLIDDAAKRTAFSNRTVRTIIEAYKAALKG